MMCVWKKKGRIVKIYICKNIFKSGRVVLGYFIERKFKVFFFDGGKGNFYNLDLEKEIKNLRGRLIW